MSGGRAGAHHRLQCPRCGGAITYMDGAAAVACPFCRGKFFLGHDGHAGWLLEPRLRPQEAILIAKRWLRSTRRRITRIGIPRGLLAPFTWSRGFHLVWELRELRQLGTGAQSIGLGGFGGDPGEGELVWEPRFATEAHSHTISMHPLADKIRGGATRLQSQTLLLLDPDKLPFGYQLLEPARSGEEAGEMAAGWRRGRRRQKEHEKTARASTPVDERLNLVALPVVVVPYFFRREYRGGVVVDAVSGSVCGDVDETELASLPEVDAESGWMGEAFKPPVLLPLECGDCGWELAWAERDRLHPCPNCGACWEIQGDAHRKVRQWVLQGENEPEDRWLPFWVFGDGNSEGSPPAEAVYVPAYTARHWQQQLHLAASLTRIPPVGPWCSQPDHELSGASAGSSEAKAWHWAVAGSIEKESLSEFLRFLKEDGKPPVCDPAGLVWLPFSRRGGDLVQRQTGAITRALGTLPWGAIVDSKDL